MSIASSFSSFGDLTPMLAPRSVAVIGASDREGNLGGAAVQFLRKFAFQGPVWPVNGARDTVAGLPCFPDLAALPGTPDLAILAVPADALAGALSDCAARGIPAAVAWAGGFAEQGEEGRLRQEELAAVCRESGIRLCGPNCIGIINTGIGLTASFSSMLYDHARLTPGAVSMVSQSGGISVMAHSRAQHLGLGFRVTVSVGNEACLGVPDFIRALAQDDGTRVIAVYTEGLSNPDGFIDALALARRNGKPVVMLKGGATEASSRAALAHTGRLAGLDRTYDAIFREFAVIRVHSIEELLDVALQLATLHPSQLPAGDRVLISSFGGGSGVMATDQCGREGLRVPALAEADAARVRSLLTPLSSALNPVDLTPGMMTNAQNRARMPEALQAMANVEGVDAWLFMAAGFAALAPQLMEMIDTLRRNSDMPVLLAWQSMPEGIAEQLAGRGIHVFTEPARAVKVLGHLARYARDLRESVVRSSAAPLSFDWPQPAASDGAAVVSEHEVARILEGTGLPVARGRLARSAEEALAAAREVGFPVAVKGISPRITHRAAAGLVALQVVDDEAVHRVHQEFEARAAALEVTLDGVWVQHMFEGDREMLVTAFRDGEFGAMVGCGLGGGLTEVIDDVVFARAPLDEDAATALIGRLRTLNRLPDFLPEAQRGHVARFLAHFSRLAASAPYEAFTLEINPVKVAPNAAAAVDGLLVIG